MEQSSDLSISDYARILGPRNAMIGHACLERYLEPHMKHLQKAVLKQGENEFLGYQLFREAKALPENLDLILVLQDDTSLHYPVPQISDALDIARWYALVLDKFLETDETCFEFPYRSAVGLVSAAATVREYVLDYEDVNEESLLEESLDCLDKAEDYVSVALGLFDLFMVRTGHTKARFYRAQMLQELAESYLLAHELAMVGVYGNQVTGNVMSSRISDSQQVSLVKAIATYEELFKEEVFKDKESAALALDNWGRALMYVNLLEIANKGLEYRVIAQRTHAEQSLNAERSEQ